MRHHPDPVAEVVANEQVPGGIEHQPGRGGELGTRGRAAVAGEAILAVAGDRVDVPGLHGPAVETARRDGDRPDPLVVNVPDQQVPGAVHRHTLRSIELGAGGPAAVAGESRRAVAGHGVDVPRLHGPAVEGPGPVRHHPDPVVAGVGDEHVPGGVHRYPRRPPEPGLGGGAAVAGEPGLAVTGYRVDVPGLHGLPVEGAGADRHHPDSVVALVGDQQVAGGSHRQARRASQELEFGGGGRTAVADEPIDAVAGHGIDVPGLHGLAVESPVPPRHHQNPLLDRVLDHQVPCGVHRDPAHVTQGGPGCGATIAGRPGTAGPRGGGQPVGPWVHFPDRRAVGNEQVPATERHQAHARHADGPPIAERHPNGPRRAADTPRHRGDHPGRQHGARCARRLRAGRRGRRAAPRQRHPRQRHRHKGRYALR